ncbi:MAG: nucleoside deaminase [Acholeplasmataceae bacterium]|jgi:tRNA(adenine34) deaminase|nr:nucleoside deaminase [Acholeplasmataceae bacterium]
MKIAYKFMKEALKEAEKAYQKNEVPIGCVIVCGNKIIAKAHNLRETKNSTLAHAELLAIKKANEKLNSWRLEDCDIYVTLEPCPMCAGAIIQARMRKLYFSTRDFKSGAFGGVFNLNAEKLNHTLEIDCGILKDESEQLLKKFFTDLRTK